MTNDERDWLHSFKWMQSRIPKIDALSAFAPAGHEDDPALKQMHDRSGFSRWFPVAGGHRVLFPFERGSYDASRFTFEPEGWDHETCKVCRAAIPSMTLCWVTESGPYIVLCARCHDEVESSRA